MKSELKSDPAKMQQMLALRDKIPSASKELFRYRLDWNLLKEV